MRSVIGVPDVQSLLNIWAISFFTKGTVFVQRKVQMERILAWAKITGYYLDLDPFLFYYIQGLDPQMITECLGWKVSV